MPRIYWGPMVLGALFAVVSLGALTLAIVFPFLEVLVTFDPCDSDGCERQAGRFDLA